ncbi:MAG TPA: cysteine desulfurase family protein [Kofleriaceae bacterium]|nr:cysteine desulfurase family protein [Kofleriaceae bacterium]
MKLDTSSKDIYLDNAATTRVCREVASVVVACMEEAYGNPASAHHLGIAAERLVGEAREKLLAAVGDPGGAHGDVIWTSGGTESDALGVMGAARARKKRGRHLLYSSIEHSAVRESINRLARGGWDAAAIPAGASGVIDVADLLARVTAETQVVALMLVNNEIGTIQPVAEAVAALRAAGRDVHVHCDAVQALGKIAVDVVALGADTVAFSAHKIHGPKGSGALWVKKGTHLDAMWGGGGHQDGVRSGTLNVPGIAGLGEAVRLAESQRAGHTALWTGFGATLIGAARAAGLDFRVNGDGAPRSPHVVSLAFQGVPAEPLLHTLESRGVMVSAGSACSERDRRPSPVLQAIALPPDYGTVRLSFGHETTAAQVERAAAILVDAVKSFR